MDKRTSEQKPQTVTMKINRVLLDQFDEVLKRKGINRSEAIRAYMVEYIEKNTK